MNSSFLLFLLFLLNLTSCSLKKMAIRSSTPVFEDSSIAMMSESNWDFFRESAPGQLKLMEVLWEQDRGNSRLLAVLTKSFAGYAFGVAETLAWEEDFKGEDNGFWKKQAIAFYTRALDYGLIYLNQKRLTRNDLLTAQTDQLMEKLKKLGTEDVTALLYTAQAWGSLINLQKDNVALVSQVPKVKMLFDRVCELRPDVEANACDLFYAQYESSRPKILGGDPEKGERLFLEAMKKYPKNLLLRMSYIQYVIVPAMDLEKFEKVASGLRQEFTHWENLNRDQLVDESEYKKDKNLNLINSFAKKRFEIMEKFKHKVF